LSGGKHFIDIRESENAANPANQKWIRYPVDYIIGSKWQQAYATLLPDSRILVFPIQYSRRHSTWLNYWKIVDAPNSERADISRFHRAPEGAVYQNTCAACHTSQLKFETRGPSGPILLDRPKATFREGGINCEMCHGPSLDHVEAMRGPKVRLERDTDGFESETPIRFRQLPPAQYLKICAQCHAQSAVHDALPGGAVNYSEDSAPFYRAYAAHLPSNFSRKAFYRDGRYRATTFISEAFARSKCFRKGGATCGSCHDPHPPSATTNPTSLKFGEDADEMCVQCHTTMRQQPERHTRHRTGTDGSRCVSCHMPRNMDALLFPARSHQIDEIPDAAMTARFGNALSPNACLGCHGDRDIAWLEYQLAKW
jgi:predicted CXXCH cytochrome family protein